MPAPKSTPTPALMPALVPALMLAPTPTLIPPLIPPPIPPPKVLLTGFDAFGGAALNPSWLAVQALHNQVITGHDVVAAQLPTAFASSTKALTRLLQQHRPALVICVGQAGGRKALSLERVAVNVIDACIADNLGAQPIDQPVLKNGPAAYFSTLPIKAMLQAIQCAGLAAEISQTAGTFVCNQVFYSLMHALMLAAKRQQRQQPSNRRSNAIVRGGFIHVPYLPEQGLPSMALQQMVQGLRVAVDCALKTAEDPVVAAGSLN